MSLPKSTPSLNSTANRRRSLAPSPAPRQPGARCFPLAARRRACLSTARPKSHRHRRHTLPPFASQFPFHTLRWLSCTRSALSRKGRLDAAQAAPAFLRKNVVELALVVGNSIATTARQACTVYRTPQQIALD